MGLALVALAACSNGNKYVNALPKDAVVVISADLKQMSAKADLNSETGKAAIGKLSAALKSGLEGSADLVDQIVKDPAESGLDLREKVYFFAEPRMAVAGILAKVGHIGKVTRFLDALAERQVCGKVQESEGCRWTTIGHSLVAYTGSSFLWVTEKGGRDPKEALHHTASLLRQKDKEGYASTGDFERLEAASADMAGIYSLGFIPQGPLAPLTLGASAEMRPEDIKWFFTLGFEEGKVVSDVRNITTDKVMNTLFEKQLQATRPVKGSYLDLFPADTPMWLTFNLKGSTFYEMLRQNAALRQQFDNAMMPIDFKRIFDALDGDFVLAITDFDNFSIVTYADVDNNSFLQTFEGLKPLLAMTNGQMQLLDRGTDAYEFRMNNMQSAGLPPLSIRFGVKDGHFYLANHQESVNARPSGATLRDTEWGKQVAGKRGYLMLKWQALAPLVSRFGSEEAATFLKILNGMDYLTFQSSDGKDGRWECLMKDRKTNVLEQLVREMAK